MMEMIPFYLIFPNVVGFLGAIPFSTYILSETRNYVYIIFCAMAIISSATRNHSNISLATTKYMFLAPREYLSFTYFSLQFIPKKIVNTTLCKMKSINRINCRQIAEIKKVLICTYEPRHDETNKMSVRPAKTQINLGIRPVWSVFAVCSMRS